MLISTHCRKVHDAQAGPNYGGDLDGHLLDGSFDGSVVELTPDESSLS